MKRKPKIGCDTFKRDESKYTDDERRSDASKRFEHRIKEKENTRDTNDEARATERTHTQPMAASVYCVCEPQIEKSTGHSSATDCTLFQFQKNC